MANWIMIDPQTKDVKRRYVAAEADQSIWLYREPHAEHRQVPDGVRLEYAKVNEDDSVVEDPALIEAETEQKWDRVRAERDVRLAECDWTQIPDSPLNDAMKANWRTYRQELRDIPQSQSDPDNIVWPETPAT